MSILPHINYLAFAVAVVVYFAIGGLWFSALFGKAWLSLTGLRMDDDAKKNVGKIFAVTFLINIIICFAAVCVVQLVHPAGAMAAVKLGVLLGGGFMAAPCAMNYMYAQRDIKLTMIDAGYHVVSITVVTVLLSLWK